MGIFLTARLGGSLRALDQLLSKDKDSGEI